MGSHLSTGGRSGGRQTATRTAPGIAVAEAWVALGEYELTKKQVGLL